jgi:hypothetical protein
VIYIGGLDGAKDKWNMVLSLKPITRARTGRRNENLNQVWRLGGSSEERNMNAAEVSGESLTGRIGGLRAQPFSETEEGLRRRNAAKGAPWWLA